MPPSWPTATSPAKAIAERLAELIAKVRAECEAQGRDPDSIEINAMFGAQMADPAAGAEQLRELGVGRAMVPAFFFAGDGGLDRLREFADVAITD